ncbi:zinc finger MYM-type protein 3-like [Saccostrea echinata]|uniref:zinc finger MYM-type protein 3-like n=1 Tax=Saccostrea echinata TaxID=191078 RepID=UPI002A83FF71|nr:zinc finger MYM-type protein 3-like [Saccostrea echinata]
MDKRTPREIEMGDRVLESLARSIGELDELIESENSTENFVMNMRNPNTVRKTSTDVNKILTWLRSKNRNRDICDIPAAELNTYLAQFFMTVTKQNGEQYEPNTLKSIQCSINRFLAEKGSNLNIIEDREFKHSRDVLLSKRKLLRQQGKRNKDRRADPLTQNEIDILYSNNFLDGANPKALSNTVYLNNSMYFGMRSRTEHVNLRWGDIELKETSTVEKFLELSERATKTRTGVTGETRAFAPKMFEEKGNPRCPVKMYLLYKRKRPDKMLTEDSPFYIGINRKPTGDSWYMSQPNESMGKNTLGNIIKLMCEGAGIQGRKVNHSVRKTAITTLVHAGIPPTLVQQHSGHKNIASINNYSTASINQQKGMSDLLSNFSKGKTTDAAEEVNDDLGGLENVLQQIGNYEFNNDIINNMSAKGLFTSSTINGNVTINFCKE